MSSQSLNPDHVLFDGLPVSLCLVDSAGCLVAMNRHALATWGVDPTAVLGRPLMQTLGIAPIDSQGDAWGRLSRPGARPRIPCRITTADGQAHPASLLYVALGTPPSMGAVFIIDTATAEMLVEWPEWAYLDPITGLGNRHLWERELPGWLSRSGCVAFFDLDDLKEVNDLHGHIAGDKLLAITGHRLASVAPPGALVVRYGGDEFVAVWPDSDEAAAEAWAESAIHQTAMPSAVADLPVVPHLSHGVAAFGPGGLPQAIRQADARLYERKGVLLSASTGGRIILTREGRAALRDRDPGDTRTQPPPGNFGAGFGPEFDGYLRAQFARAEEQAREFVAFVDPRPGSAVVEVGAGSGRITFDGGLAERIGRQGQLLVTDPSTPQLLTARKAANDRGFDWVRFLPAPAEHLPLASGTVDLVVGVLFLQFTDPEQALREMARVVRPDGRVAIGAGLAFAWPPAWEEILAPVRQEVERNGLPWRHVFLTERAIREHISQSGLEIEQSHIVGPETADFQQVEIAAAFWRQNGLVRLLLRGVPVERCAPVQEAFDARLRDVFSRTTPEERRITTELIYLVARKRG